MDSEVSVKILSKHMMKFFKLSDIYFAAGADKEKFAYWLADKCVNEGWIKIEPESLKKTLHPLNMNTRYLGGKAQMRETHDVLPKGSTVVIVKMGEGIL